MTETASATGAGYGAAGRWCGPRWIWVTTVEVVGSEFDLVDSNTPQPGDTGHRSSDASALDADRGDFLADNDLRVNGLPDNDDAVDDDAVNDDAVNDDADNDDAGPR